MSLFFFFHSITVFFLNLVSVHLQAGRPHSLAGFLWRRRAGRCNGCAGELLPRNVVERHPVRLRLGRDANARPRRNVFPAAAKIGARGRQRPWRRKSGGRRCRRELRLPASTFRADTPAADRCPRPSASPPCALPASGRCSAASRWHGRDAAANAADGAFFGRHRLPLA